MSKQKYPVVGGSVTTTGERKQRDYTNSGKLNRRREQRRLEAIGRQAQNIQDLEQALEKAKDKTEAQAALTHAQLTLQKIRGGVNQRELVSRFTAKQPKETNESQSKSAQESKKNRK